MMSNSFANEDKLKAYVKKLLIENGNSVSQEECFEDRHGNQIRVDLLTEDTLIEAKVALNNTRNVRSVTGQIGDYSRIVPRKRLVVLTSKIKKNHIPIITEQGYELWVCGGYGEKIIVHKPTTPTIGKPGRKNPSRRTIPKSKLKLVPKSKIDVYAHCCDLIRERLDYRVGYTIKHGATVIDDKFHGKGHLVWLHIDLSKKRHNVCVEFDTLRCSYGTYHAIGHSGRLWGYETALKHGCTGFSTPFRFKGKTTEEILARVMSSPETFDCNHTYFFNLDNIEETINFASKLAQTLPNRYMSNRIEYVTDIPNDKTILADIPDGRDDDDRTWVSSSLKTVKEKYLELISCSRSDVSNNVQLLATWERCQLIKKAIEAKPFVSLEHQLQIHGLLVRW